jgi:hypothetical protein
MVKAPRPSTSAMEVWRTCPRVSTCPAIATPHRGAICLVRGRFLVISRQQREASAMEQVVGQLPLVQFPQIEENAGLSCSPDDLFEYGPARLLDGFAALLEHQARTHSYGRGVQADSFAVARGDSWVVCSFSRRVLRSWAVFHRF